MCARLCEPLLIEWITLVTESNDLNYMFPIAVEQSLTSSLRSFDPFLVIELPQLSVTVGPFALINTTFVVNSQTDGLTLACRITMVHSFKQKILCLFSPQNILSVVSGLSQRKTGRNVLPVPYFIGSFIMA